jgi:tetraacyldisaccharide 4'-kinase
MPEAPKFWAKPGLLSGLFLPLGWGHAALGAARRRFSHAWRASVPVICVGNLVAGGAGRTPVSLSLAQILTRAGLAPHILSRGYRARLKGPLRVDPARHSAAEVGDEPLLLARAAPTWIGADRVASARAAIAAGAGILLLDDGLQNPYLHQDLRLVVIDGAYGLGNGRVIPAGPLREPAAAGLARASAIVLMGQPRPDLALAGKTVLRATLAPRDGDRFKDKAVIAFAGIGQPKKFFKTLEEIGAVLAGAHAFADHHPYRDTELARLAAEASENDAALVTTEKDWVRIAPAWRQRTSALKVEVEWVDEAALHRVLAPAMERAHG